MNPFDWRTPRAAFQPPSDMTNGGGGSSTTKKVFVGLGIGCGIIMIIIGIMFAAGAFKAVTCCNEVKNIADTSVGAEAFGREFAQEIWEGKLDEAYARTSADYQSNATLEQFKAAIAVHSERMKANQPRLFNMQLEQHGGENPSLESIAKGTWLMSYQFAGPADDTMLLLIFRVAAKQGEGEQGFEIREVNFDERERSLAGEPPAAEVERTHGMLKRGQYEAAYMRFGDAFRQSSDMQAFREFMKSTTVGDALRSTPQLDFKHVGYNESNTQATVLAAAKRSDGTNVILQFELQPAAAELPGMGWRIVTIAETVAESGDTDPSPNGAEVDANGETNQGTTNGADDVDAVKPPTVDVK